jgi:hypothetical protein
MVMRQPHMAIKTKTQRCKYVTANIKQVGRGHQVRSTTMDSSLGTYQTARRRIWLKPTWRMPRAWTAPHEVLLLPPAHRTQWGYAGCIFARAHPRWFKIMSRGPLQYMWEPPLVGDPRPWAPPRFTSSRTMIPIPCKIGHVPSMCCARPQLHVHQAHGVLGSGGIQESSPPTFYVHP